MRAKFARTCILSDVRRSALPLVEVLVVIGILGIMVALFLPSVRTSREAARRNSCLNNFKQLAIAIQSYHDARKSMPLASTAPFVQAGSIPKYGEVGSASRSAESPTNWTAGRQGDGYSWIVQCLPFMEETALYEKLTLSQDTSVVRNGKLADAAFAPSSNLNFEKSGSTASPYFWSIKIAAFVSPSFPGEEDVAAFGEIPGDGLKVGSGNYVALAATHYRSASSHHLESGLPNMVGPDAGGRDCSTGAFCGNGGLPFPGVVGGKVQKFGRAYSSLWEGTSKIALITESREETLTSWYSGLASYVVAAMPAPNGGTPGSRATGAGQAPNWSCVDIPNCDTALNKGDPKSSTATKFYQPTSPHGGGPRIWGPSSRHPGVVIHSFADAHSESINDDIDKEVYVQLVRKAELIP